MRDIKYESPSAGGFDLYQCDFKFDRRARRIGEGLFCFAPANKTTRRRCDGRHIPVDWCCGECVETSSDRVVTTRRDGGISTRFTGAQSTARVREIARRRGKHDRAKYRVQRPRRHLCAAKLTGA